MPRCGSLPHSSGYRALPTAAPGDPAVPLPTHLPFQGARRVPLWAGALGGFTMWQNPRQGALGLSQGQTTPVQVPCPRKLEGHVSVSGVTPDMHPALLPLSPHTPLSSGLCSAASSYRSFCRCHHWTGLAWNPCQGTRGWSSGCMGTGCPPPPRVARGHTMALSTTAARRAPFSAVLGMEPGTGSRAAAGKPVPSGDPLTPLGPKFSEPSPCHSDAGGCRGAAPPRCPRHRHGHPWLWERAGNAPCSPVPAAFSCCASL